MERKKQKRSLPLPEVRPRKQLQIPKKTPPTPSTPSQPPQRQYEPMQIESPDFIARELEANDELQRKFYHLLQRIKESEGMQLGIAAKHYVSQLIPEVSASEPLSLLLKEIRNDAERRQICNLPRVGSQASQEEIKTWFNKCADAANNEYHSAIQQYLPVRQRLGRIKSALEEGDVPPVAWNTLFRTIGDPVEYLTQNRPTLDELNYILDETPSDPCILWDKKEPTLQDLQKCQEAWYRRREFAHNFYLASHKYPYELQKYYEQAVPTWNRQDLLHSELKPEEKQNWLQRRTKAYLKQRFFPLTRLQGDFTPPARPRQVRIEEMKTKEPLEDITYSIPPREAKRQLETFFHQLEETKRLSSVSPLEAISPPSRPPPSASIEEIKKQLQAASTRTFTPPVFEMPYEQLEGEEAGGTAWLEARTAREEKRQAMEREARFRILKEEQPRIQAQREAVKKQLESHFIRAPPRPPPPPQTSNVDIKGLTSLLSQSLKFRMPTPPPPPPPPPLRPPPSGVSTSPLYPISPIAVTVPRKWNVKDIDFRLGEYRKEKMRMAKKFEQEPDKHVGEAKSLALANARFYQMIENAPSPTIGTVQFFNKYIDVKNQEEFPLGKWQREADQRAAQLQERLRHLEELPVANEHLSELLQVKAEFDKEYDWIGIPSHIAHRLADLSEKYASIS